MLKRIIYPCHKVGIQFYFNNAMHNELFVLFIMLVEFLMWCRAPPLFWLY